jgi:hypothetical protein
MKTSMAWAAAMGLVMAQAAQAAAQDAGSLGPGVRVRLSVASSRDRLQGTVQALDQATLSVISDDHQLVKVPRDSITRLETGWGRRGNARRGLAIGAVFGAGLGLLICAADESDWGLDPHRDYGSSCHGGGEWVALPLVSGAAYGGIGALIGHFIKSDRWVEVPMERVRVSLGPSARGLGVAISLRF